MTLLFAILVCVAFPVLFMLLFTNGMRVNHWDTLSARYSTSALSPPNTTVPGATLGRGWSGAVYAGSTTDGLHLENPAAAAQALFIPWTELTLRAKTGEYVEFRLRDFKPPLLVRRELVPERVWSREQV